MIRDFRYGRRVTGNESIAESVDAALRLAVTRRPDLDPTVLLYLPPARGNPFQSLLYRQSYEYGIGPVPVLSLADVDGFRWPDRTIVHLHWTRQITQAAESPADAEAAVDAAIEVLSRSCARGNALLWTVHNVLPHECRFPEADIRLRRWLAANADVVHVLAASTPELVTPHYELPTDGRMVHVPHPSYVGVYPDHVSADDARWELGLDPHHRVAVVVGSQRAYKGIDVLRDALRHLGDDWRAIVAGNPVEPEDREALLAMAADEPRLLVCPRRIAGEEMQLFHRAADVGVVPYADGLNSGAAFLALSFGLPLVGSDIGALPEVIDPSFGETFPVGDANALAVALESVVTAGLEQRRAAAVERANAARPEVVSDGFFRSITDALEGRSP